MVLTWFVAGFTWGVLVGVLLLFGVIISFQ
jgi:hypothetical protein